jgi:16S rRNA (uracil1498-N3)-methyltransferase
MRIPRFYQPSPNHLSQSNQAESLKVGQILPLSATNFRHAIQVMRLKLSSQLIIFDGEGGEYQAQLSDIGKKSASIEILSFDPVDRESPLSSKLVLALIKADKFDFALQKAVELGVSAIQPVRTDRSVINIKASRLEKKMKHWQGVIHSACEQSGRTKVPELLPLVNFQDYLNIQTSSLQIVMLPTAQQSLKQLASDSEISNEMTSQNDVAVDLLIGPEGGFTDYEEELLAKNKITAITFGSRILRAETAVVAGLTALQTIWGDCAG